MFTAAILTISDRVYQGVAQDSSGPAIRELLEQHGFVVEATRIVPDSIQDIQLAIHDWADVTENPIAFIVTTGGTGFGIRDMTPEAVKPLIEKEATGIMFHMYQTALGHTKLASLSRGIAGVRKSSFILTLPGSVKACKENLGAVLEVLPHALNLIRGENQLADSFHRKLHGGHHHHTCTSSKSTDHHSVHHAHSVAHRPRKSTYPMIPFNESLDLIRRHVTRIEEVIEVDIQDTTLNGSVLAQDVLSPVNIPAFRASVVDGYAVVSQDGPGAYPVTNSSIAAPGNPSRLLPGSIIRVTTGAPVPDGSDAVVMVEDTTLEESDGDEEKRVCIHTKANSGQFIRDIGSDVQKDQLLFSKGTLFSSSGFEVALLSSVGIQKVLVYKKPIVAIMSTGNEVYSADMMDPLPLGAIRDANRPALKAALVSRGYIVNDVGIVKDSRQDLEDAISKGLKNADIIITTGGVSMGELDLLKPVLQDTFNAEIHFGRVNLKPGKPTTFATVPVESKRRKVVFALPGNPVSALVTFHLFVIRALGILSGHKTDDAHSKIMVEVDADIPLDSRPEFRRVLLLPGTPFKAIELEHAQQSSRLLSFRGANGLLCLPSKDETRSILKKGDLCEALLLNSL